MKRRAQVAASVVVLTALTVAAIAYRLGNGARYRLFSNTAAGDCWRAVELTTLSTSTLEPVSVGRPVRDAEGGATVSIDYTMDRVLGGATLNVRCELAPGGRLESVEFDGVALAQDELADVNRALAD